MTTPITLTEADQNRQVTVAPSQQLRLLLEENPTTGYQWEVVGLNSAVLTLANDTYESLHNVPGGGGQRALTFQAGHAGRAELHLRLRRAWETDRPPIKAFDATIQVQGE